MKNGERMALVTGIISILLNISSCKKESALWRGSIAVENGVTVVRNPTSPMFGKDTYSLEQELSVGSPKSGGEPVFSEAVDVAVDREGYMYVLDSKEACVVVFNETGGYEKTIGKKGQGPGEMQRPTNISFTPANEILVNDRGARALHFFGLGGEYKRSLSLARMPFFSRPKADSRNNIVARSMTIEPPRASFILAKFDSELNELFEIFSYEEEVSGGKIYNVYPPQCYWDVGSDDRIVWGYSSKYELQILDRQGRLGRRILRDYVPVKTTDVEKEEWIKFAFGDKGVPPDIKVNWPSYHNAFQSLCIDDSGRIFVGTYEKAPNGHGFYYDVFDLEGKCVARIPLKAAPRAAKRDRLYTIEEDEDGNQVVKRYKITWPPDLSDR